MEVLSEKVCSKCHILQPISEFRIKRDKNCKPRYSAQCASCTREYQRQYSKVHGWSDNWKATHHLEFLAQRSVSRAIKRGTLIRPDSCSLCGRICKVQGHHTDYSKPLDVTWLCPSCHKKQHI